MIKVWFITLFFKDDKLKNFVMDFKKKQLNDYIENAKI